MGKIGYGKSAVWMAVCVQLGLFAAVVISQPGFLSIACGGEMNYTAQNNIAWVTDANFINVGQTAKTGVDSRKGFGSHLHTLRFFPKPLNKSCYQLPVLPNVPFLRRLWFAVGNYTGLPNKNSFRYSTETEGMLNYGDVSLTTPQDVLYREKIVVSSGRVLYICLIRTSDSDVPFINAIELRTLADGMYGQAKPGMALSTRQRQDVGDSSWLRYPKDKFDRIWNEDTSLTSSVRQISTLQPISSSNTKNFPPTDVMQTAWTVDNYVFEPGSMEGPRTVLLLYLADIQTLNTSGPIYFYVWINGENRSDMIAMVPNNSALELTFVTDTITASASFTFELVKATASNRLPIINAYEYYWLLDTNTATDSQDVRTLEDLKNTYDLKDWISDPCYLIPWKGIGCNNTSSSNRISEIDLSGMNLTGPVPEHIGKLTSLVNMSLDNNHLNGALPNFSSLAMLERLYLQNNDLIGSIPDWLFQLKKLKELSLENNHLIGPLPNFSILTNLEVLHLQNNSLNGSVPEWLFKLKNLKELFIQNNNFSGVIRQELLENSTLNFQFLRNNHLCVSKEGKCIQNTQNSSKNVVLGITISGCSVIALALVVGVALYWRKKQRHNKAFAKILPKLTNFRAFTRKEIKDATERFSKLIGKGGSGSVFLGKLAWEDKDIAVKEVSSLDLFINEVDVHSEAKHANLMPLLGYCTESKNPMLIYEHMSGGSLWDRLHGYEKDDWNLNWETRLEIALAAAQGLEFLHADCSTKKKIIHRDVKTSNILLDNNMNAKLADFGISRVRKDGEYTYAATSAKGTPGYIDPEYDSTLQVSDRSDIYSFGVVLLEIIFGRQATKADPEEAELVKWVTKFVDVENLNAAIIDRRLAAENCNMQNSIAHVAKLALKCVHDIPGYRPSISEVVHEIKEAIILANKNDDTDGRPRISEVVYEMEDAIILANENGKG